MLALILSKFFIRGGKMKKQKLNFYEVNDEYIEYLSLHDEKL